MRIARIAWPGALYGASAPSQTFETIDETIVNPIDSEKVADVNVARLIDVGSYSHIPGFAISTGCLKGCESC